MGDYIRQATVEWARLVVSHPKALMLLMETTRIVDEDGDSYGGESEPIRFTGLSLTSGELWDYLLHPTYSKAVSDVSQDTFPDSQNKKTLHHGVLDAKVASFLTYLFAADSDSVSHSWIWRKRRFRHTQENVCEKNDAATANST